MGREMAHSSMHDTGPSFDEVPNPGGHCNLFCGHHSDAASGSSSSSPQPKGAALGPCRTVEGVARGARFLTGAAWIALSHRLSKGKHEHDDKLAHEALDLVLNMKGYYIKAAQTLCGAGQLPPEFEEAFGVLLDQCPREEFPVVKEIIEEEFGLPMHRVFSTFQEEAIAAASIGQVHFATLLDGTEVAVKVQYPHVERFFTMDVQAVSFVMQLAGMHGKVKEVFKTMQGQFQHEFNYLEEASVMRDIAENILPLYGEKVAIPLPIDGRHPACPHSLPSLCTRKVLTMERLKGVPVKKHIEPLLEMFAEHYGTTAAELKQIMNTKDPSKIDMQNKAVQAAMNMGEVSESKSRLLICMVGAKNLAGKLMGGCMAGCCHTPPPAWTKPKMVPLNGPRLSRLLFDVHGQQIFQNGLFNSDPHAGNVLMLPDGRLGLIDYGAVMRLSEEQRTPLAELFVAIADENDDAVAPAFFKCGFRSKRSDWRLALLLAHVFFNRGPFPYDMNRIAPKVGMPQNPDIQTLDSYIRGGKIDVIEEFPGHLVMLQRCSMVLSGLGMELGAGRLSAAGMFKPHALKWLRRYD